ncbi:hypothetical protein [Paenibacillus arenilitoris]|uniref:Uncharacterized protein n=1 Tax=Paenibacillus arenilitoris TaxID=2772299 RepID=A0A927H5B8_9BACL|nr:hypothetical protein [Paenibacillus arenilitoris]MBD2868247.1 hypothetical protein [Paenibacillus arenilitoris]
MRLIEGQAAKIAILFQFSNLTCVVTVKLRERLRFSPPALIPFFTQPPMLWVIPLSVGGALAGLLVTLSAEAYFEKLIAGVPFFVKRTSKADSDTAM